jgi:hypothetical protein
VSKSNAAVLVTLLAAATLSLSAVPASAASSNCAVLLVPSWIEASGAILAKEVDLGCYPTYAEALSVGSSGAIDVPDGTTGASLTDAVLAANTIVSATADVLIGTEFVGTNYTGTSKSYFAPETCSIGVVWDVGSVGASWDDRFSSGKGFGGVRHEQEVRGHELRRVRAHLHPELRELRGPVEPGVLAALETLRGRVRR